MVVGSSYGLMVGGTLEVYIVTMAMVQLLGLFCSLIMKR